MAEKSVVIKLTHEQKAAIKRATGKDISELRVDALEGRVTPFTGWDESEFRKAPDAQEFRKAPDALGADQESRKAPDALGVQQEDRKAPDALGVQQEDRKAPFGADPDQQELRKAPTSFDNVD